MKKKRTKKFNPNKLLPSQVKQLQQEAQYKKDISETYEMCMEFISSHVRDFIEDKKIGEKSLLDKFPHAETLPYHFTIGAYDYQDLSIALTPDNLGTIFSGSAVIDSFNTAGFKTGEELPMVAIYTSAGNTQSQSMAYSNDKGRNWTKYANNPVLPNPGINDFRDPKVSWYAPLKKWIMA